MRQTTLFIISLSLLFLSSCVPVFTSIKPEAMDKNGIVLAQFSTNTSSGKITDANAVINGTTYTQSIKDGHLVVQLKPGKYTFDGLEQFNNITKRYDKIRFRIDFYVQEGQITNLGLLVKYSRTNSATDGRLIIIDNEKDAVAFLKRQYPEVYAKISNKEIVPTSIKYLSPRQVNDFRRHLLANFTKPVPDGSFSDSRRPIISKNMEAGSKISYGATIVGTLGKIYRNPQGNVTHTELVDTGTFAPITITAALNGRFACIVPDPGKGNMLFITENGKFVKKPLKNMKNINMITLFKETGVVIYDDSPFLHSSSDNGSTWKKK